MASKKRELPQIHIEAVQWTPGLEPVNIHYCGLGVSKGPLAKPSICSTTQKALGALSGTPGQWGDDEVVATLEAELEESGLTAKVKLPDPPKKEAGEVLLTESEGPQA